MEVSMRSLLKGSAMALLAIVLIGAGVSLSWAAEKDKEVKKDKPKKEKTSKEKTVKEKPAKEQPAKTDRSGTAHVPSTKASGASIVAGSKACFGDPPKITSVEPDEGKAGQKVTITGKNFGVEGCHASVSFGPGNSAKITQESETSVTATVPDGHKGIRLLIVTTVSGEDSKPFLVK
jgi:hypothetical protein